LGRISKQARSLQTLLVANGVRAELEREFDVVRPDLGDLTASLRRQAISLYRKLAYPPAGKGTLPPFSPQDWDLRVEGILVELDESQHFNRYRQRTLRPSAYGGLNSFPLTLYRRYCTSYEAKCPSAAGFWTNKSCEEMFGPAAPPPIRAQGLIEFSEPGSPRWKQRAFYDFLKDLAPLCGIGSLARVSVWDEIPGCNGRTLGPALTEGARDRGTAAGVMLLIEQRANHAA
jgi:hypothetical protein